MKMFRERWNKRVQKTKHHLGIFEDDSAPSGAPFSSEIADYKKERLGNSLVKIVF